MKYNDVCQNCEEAYVNQDITHKLLNRANDASKNGAEIEVLRFAA